MSMQLYISWNVDPSIYDGFITLRYYSLFFAISFLIGFHLVKKMYINESAPAEWMDKKLVYAVLGTIIGARLGHVFFYEWDYYAKNLHEIPMVWKGGLASHGAAIALIVAMWLYSKKITKKHTLWSLDKLVIAVALASGFIRMGNLMNSEIVGLRTDHSSGFFFENATANEISSYFRLDDNQVKFYPTDKDSLIDGLRYPISNLVLTIPGIGLDSSSQSNYIQSQLIPFINTYSLDYKKHLFEELKTSIEMQGNTKVLSERDQQIKDFLKRMSENHFFTTTNSYEVDISGNTLTLPIYLIPRIPTQLWEALAYWIIFVFLFWAYWKRNWYEYNGKLFGAFLTLNFAARFIIEFYKEHQALADESVVNMGQYLSVPLVIIGLYFWIKAKKVAKN